LCGHGQAHWFQITLCSEECVQGSYSSSQKHTQHTTQGSCNVCGTCIASKADRNAISETARRYSGTIQNRIFPLQLLLHGMDYRRVGVRFPAEARYSFIHAFQAGSGAHPGSHPMSTGCFPPQIQKTVRQAETLPTTAEVKNMWSHTYTSPYAFMT
jgi:hypothetical protein